MLQKHRTEFCYLKLPNTKIFQNPVLKGALEFLRPLYISQYFPLFVKERQGHCKGLKKKNSKRVF